MNKLKRQNFIKKVRIWQSRHNPALPWRGINNPYHIFVSEIMLQQTQIPRVLIKYPEFLKAFPTVRRLADAPLRKVLLCWQGMGYNRRALYLHKAAKEILRKHGGVIPDSVTLLEMLPGIGPYSARATRCFAYGICEPFIETNIRRAIIHEFFPRKKNISDKEILRVLHRIQPDKHEPEWYGALMDYGRDALRHIPNPNRKSARYARQSRFEGSPRYIRAKIISYLLENKKATIEEFRTSLKKDKHLTQIIRASVTKTLAALEKEKLMRKSGRFFYIAS